MAGMETFDDGGHGPPHEPHGEEPHIYVPPNPRNEPVLPKFKQPGGNIGPRR
jgi:hypothetical protein